MTLERKKIENLDDYFVELSKRKEKGVYFYRINGTSDTIRQFLYKYFDTARKAGVIIEGKIANPTETNLSYYNEIMGMDFQLSDSFINNSLRKWLPRMGDSQRQVLSTAIYNSLVDMHRQGKNENILKNAYIKFMCWLYYKFERIVNQLGQESVPKILYEGMISNYELMLISILCSAGCDVVIIQKAGEQSYLKVDPASKKSDKYEENGMVDFPADFTIKQLMDNVQKENTPKPVNVTRLNSAPSNAPDTGIKQDTAGIKQAGKLHINISRPGSLNRAGNQSTAANNTASNTAGTAAKNTARTAASNMAANNTVSGADNHRSAEPVNLGPVIRCTNAWIKGEGLSDILDATSLRGTDSNLYYNCYCRINGVVDRLTYANELYQFYISMKNAKRQVVIVNNSIPRPTTDEIMSVKRSNYVRLEQVLAGLRANIQYPVNPELRDIMVRSFEEILTEEARNPANNINKLVNKGVYLICWLKRYQSEIFHNWKRPNVGCFIYFGGCKDYNEAMFMRFLARLPVDVLILCPNLNEKCCLEDRYLYEINYENSMVLSEFPEQNAQLHIGTAAYHAERDLDNIMYNDSVVFRDQQFTKANVISLQTMDREIKILWNNDLKFRPNFSTVDGVVNIPVIFSKMSGVKDGKVDEYWISIKQLMTPETIVINQAPFIKSNSPNPVKMYVTEFFKNGKLQRNKIKNHPSYQYGFLREEMQEHMLDKLEMLIEQRLIKGTFENGTEYTIISVALNLPKEVTRLIQKFDFTKKNPKLIYINAAESLISLEDTIYVTYLNLLGFDIVFFIPTGYNIEGYFNKKLMEEHQLGEYVYDLQVPNWETVPLTAQKSWRDKFFRKG